MEILDRERQYDDELIEMEPLPVMFEKTAERHSDRPAQKYKGGAYDRSLVAAGAINRAPDDGFATVTWGEYRDIVRKLATGFRALGVDHGDRIGIFAPTRMEWAHSDFAIQAAGGIVTTVYKSSSPQQVQYLLDDPGASGVVVENEELLERVLEVIDLLSVRFVVVMDEIGPEYADRDGVYTLGDVYREGAKRYDVDAYEGWIEAIDPDDLASLVYTSGTTGQPKGVELTHRNFRSNVNQGYARVAPRDDRPGDAFVLDEHVQTVSFLPLNHVLERTIGHYIPHLVGACVAYAESVDTLKEDFGTIRPTFTSSVPRVFEKIYDGIREEAEQKEVAGYPVGERIFEWAVEIAREYERASKPSATLKLKMKVADKLVFEDVREALGGNVEMMISGGGTLAKDIATVFHGMGLPIIEGYGLTEAAPGVTFNPPEAYKTGTIGVPLVGQDVKIDPSVVPEQQFEDAIGEFGELLVTGPNVTDGYWNKPEKTDAAFTDDGYFRTGDIVQRRPDGYYVFRERAKQILVLSTGKNVAPAPIEDSFSDSGVVEQCMVMGNGEKFVAALVVPDFERIRAAAAEEGIDLPEDPGALCTNDVVREAISEEIDRVNRGFEPHEQIKRFRLVPEEWTEANGMLTPTLKKKRRTIRDEYADLVEDIYSEESVAGDEGAASPEPAE